tara:strand:+ start:68 stop:247 length:180 start_codon:yes stop_codon:yes gene_type:complete
MKEVELSDPYGKKRIRMCNKHYDNYIEFLKKAAAGGTSYKVWNTSKRGCHICKKSNNKN